MGLWCGRRALQNLVSINLGPKMRALHSETILTSSFFIFTYYQDVIHEKFLMQKELLGVFLIDGLFQAYSPIICNSVLQNLMFQYFNRVKRN